MEYVSAVPPADSDDKRRLKYPEVCAELLGAEVWQLTEAVYRDAALLGALYGFLARDYAGASEAERAAEATSARVATLLCQHKVDETVAFLRQVPGCVARLVAHVADTNVVELLLKLLATDDGAGAAAGATVQWLCAERFVPLLLDRFVASTDPEEQEAIAHAVTDMVLLLGAQGGGGASGASQGGGAQDGAGATEARTEGEEITEEVERSAEGRDQDQDQDESSMNGTNNEKEEKEEKDDDDDDDDDYESEDEDEDLVCFAHADGHRALPPKVHSKPRQ